MNYKFPLRVGRAFARLFTASRGPSVGRQETIVRDQWERPAEGACPQRSCRAARSGLVRQDMRRQQT